MPKNKKLALDSGIQTNQILRNGDEVCIPRLSKGGFHSEGIDAFVILSNRRTLLFS